MYARINDELYEIKVKTPNACTLWGLYMVLINHSYKDFTVYENHPDADGANISVLDDGYVLSYKKENQNLSWTLDDALIFSSAIDSCQKHNYDYRGGYGLETIEILMFLCHSGLLKNQESIHQFELKLEELKEQKFFYKCNTLTKYLSHLIQEEIKNSTDYVGQRLRVDDVVAFSSPHDGILRIAKIIKFQKDQVLIEQIS